MSEQGKVHPFRRFIQHFVDEYWFLAEEDCNIFRVLHVKNKVFEDRLLWQS